MRALHWDPGFYKTGYEGFERSENFPSAEELERYRAMLLRKTTLQVAFIARHFARNEGKLRVIEFCSGNGRLLIALAQTGLLEYGLGVEIAESRVRFARQWTEDLKLRNIQHIAADALALDDIEPQTFDLSVCLTGAFQYFRPIRESAPGELLKKMRDALRQRGAILLELYQMPERRRQMLALNEGRLKLWQALPPEDRFLYYLDDFEYWESQRILRHSKIFIGRDGHIDAGRVEVLAYYSQAELVEILFQNGFEDVRIQADFEEGIYREGSSTGLVAYATKSN